MNIDSLTGANSAAGGSLTQANGNLVIGTGGINLTGLTQNGGSISSAGNVTAADLTQTNGTLSTTGNLTLSNSFSQSATGVITVGGNTSITDLIDGIALGNLNTTGTTQVTSRGGNITQNAGTSITSVGTSTWVAQSSSNPATDYDITLTNEGNDFVGAVTASGKNISITDKNALTAALSSAGNSSISAGGNLAVSGSSTGNLTTSTTGTGTTSYGVTNVGGNLASSSAGDVTQTGALSVTGTTALSATGKDVTLDNIANQFVGAMSFVAKDVVIGASKPVTVVTRNVNSLRFVGNAEATAANAARGTAAQIPVQPVVTPMTLTPVFVPTTPTVGLGTANVGTNGVSGGLVFVDAPSAAPANNDTPNNTAKPATSTGGSGIDASGFMRVSVVNGGIKSGSGNNE